LRCVGKTTVGRELAQALALPFFDLDHELAGAEGSGRSAGELLAELGEDAFRALELTALRDCLSRGALVLATGGGVIESEESRTLLSERSRVIWLDAPDEVLLARRAADETLRPTLVGADPKEELASMGPRRRSLYGSLSGAPAEAGEREVIALARDLAERYGGAAGAYD